MKHKLLFWHDVSMVHFALAKYIQDNFDCELFAIFDIANKSRLFFETQQFVNYKKIWFYYDYILKTKRKPNLDYLRSIEEKYDIPLWLIASNDRFFNHFNTYHKFSYDEILLILEDEIKIFEKILDQVNPDYMIFSEWHQQHNYIFYKVCKARKIKILMMSPTRTGAQIKGQKITNDRYYLTNEFDQFLPLPNIIKTSDKENIASKRVSEFTHSDSDNMDYPSVHNSISYYFSAFLKYLFTEDTNVKTHFTYFGRSKLKVIFKTIVHELRAKYRKNFMDKNLDYSIRDDLPFIYFPLHQELERVLLIAAPFYQNQFEQIKNIAQSLPTGYKLYVKEHPAMRVRGWRSVSEMKKIMKLYNVHLLHPSMDQAELISKCDLVITIKGTAAIDAIFHKKPSIIFENVGLYKLSCIHKLESITELPDAIKNSLKKKIDPDEIDMYIKAVDKISFQSAFNKIEDAFREQFGVGGYYVNVDIDSQKMKGFLDKFSTELTELAMIHIQKIKERS